MDRAVERAHGISDEVATRAHDEVEQHRIAVQALKAAPTSAEQLRQLACLESKARSALEEDREPFLALQSAVWEETARIHQMMRGVRLRAMTMPVRYQYLIEVPSLEGEPRQHVPAQFAGRASPNAATEYLEWFYAEADGACKVLFQQVQQLLAHFNSALWAELGLVRERFPWMIRASTCADVSGSRLPQEEAFSPGDVLISRQTEATIFGKVLPEYSATLCFVLQETSSCNLRVHRSGMDSAEEVRREDLRTCAGGGVVVPGPKKVWQRCLDKIAADYEGHAVPWPAAASLTDLSRCQIVLDDPYAMAVPVEFLRRKRRVVRLKNRFSGDVLESRSPAELQSIFASSSCNASDTESRKPSTGSDKHRLAATAYRDVSMNVEVTTPSGVPFICEIQLTLVSLAILKHADQQLYSIRRMSSPVELQTTYVFSKPVV